MSPAPRPGTPAYNNIISKLLVLFFLLAFVDATIKTNAYLIAPTLILATICLSIFRYRFSFPLTLLAAASCTIPFLPAADTARIIKTLLIGAIIPFCIINYRHRDSAVLRFYMEGTAVFVLLEAAYFALSGRTIIVSTPIMLGWPRFQALFSDSNFLCHALVSYIIYERIKNGRTRFHLVAAVVASLSFSAVANLILFFLYNPLLAKRDRRNRSIRFVLGCLTASAFAIYFLLLFVAGDIRTLASGDVAAFKLVSLAIRFDMQYAALLQFWNSGSFFIGLGAGAAKEITEYGLNLHNTYIQILIESGILVFCYVAISIGAMYAKTNIRMLPHLSICIVTGNILEVYYFPLLFFVFYLSRLLEHQEQPFTAETPR